MISLKLPNGTFYPLVSQLGETHEFALTPAVPGEHPIIIPFFSQSENQVPQLLGIVKLDGSGEELALTISLDDYGQYSAIVIDSGNGARGSIDSQSTNSTDLAQENEFDPDQNWQEQIALVDNYFDGTTSKDNLAPSYEPSLDSSQEFESDVDHAHSQDFGEEEDLFEDSEDYDEELDEPLDEAFFEDDDPVQNPQPPKTKHFPSHSSAEANVSVNPWIVAGIGTLVLALGYLGAYGVFTSLRSEAFPLIEQLFF